MKIKTKAILTLAFFFIFKKQSFDPIALLNYDSYSINCNLTTGGKNYVNDRI